ncbi:MAG: glycosyltransferase family 2 protein [Firmicutes bacterium]|nr:glycosyltransferase family 2 protein [Bacillota bacterium]
MRILIIIPAYNEESNIGSVISNLNSSNNEVDYVVINDCSTDNTKHILNEMHANFLDLPVNLGIGGGVQLGYMYAHEKGYDIAIQMDGDGQHDPKYINDIINPILKGEADMVVGSRFINKDGFQSTGLRRFGIKFLSLLIKIFAGIEICDVTSGFRAANKKMIEIFSKHYAQDYPEPEAIVAASAFGCKVKEVPVVMHERMGGASSIHSFKSVYYMIKVSIAIALYKRTLNVKG